MNVFLVVQHEGPDGSLLEPFIIEREGVHLPEHKVWNVNLRGYEGRSKLIQSVHEDLVYRTREAAEKRLLELVPEEDKLR